MELTSEAENRLKHLLRKAGNVKGFSVESIIGSCRGSTPHMKPVDCAGDGELEVPAGDFVFYAKPDIAEKLEISTIEYDGSFLGTGLTLHWEQCPGCTCND